MKSDKRSPEQIKILEGMDKVYEKLIEFKKRMNSENSTRISRRTNIHLSSCIW